MKKAATLSVDPEYTKLSVQLPVCDIYDCEFKIKSMTFECGHNEYLSFQMKIYTSTLSGYTSVNVKRNTIDLYCGSSEGKGGSSCFRKTCVPECICFSISPQTQPRASIYRRCYHCVACSIVFRSEILPLKTAS